MLLKDTSLTASSSRLVDSPTSLGEAPEGFFRLGGRALQGVTMLAQGRNLGLLGALPRERAAEGTEHEVLLVLEACDILIILALVGAQLVEVFTSRAQRILPGLGRHDGNGPGSGAANGSLRRREAASSIVGGHEIDQCRAFSVRGAAFHPALPDLL